MQLLVSALDTCFRHTRPQLSCAHSAPLTCYFACNFIMMASSRGNNFRVTGPLWGASTSPQVVFPSQRPVTRSFGVFFDLRLNKRLSKHRNAGDTRRHRAHYDVTVMMAIYTIIITILILDITYDPHAGGNFESGIFIDCRVDIWKIISMDTYRVLLAFFVDQIRSHVNPL